jgi:fermentation-respiration switch protein FrsA (DUF1100 family)
MSQVYTALKKIFYTVIVVYIIFGLILVFFQEKFIYFPSNQDFNNCPVLANMEKVTFNETRMYVQKTTDNWVVFYHGNAGSACDRSYIMNYFDSSDYSYIFVEYTGYSNDDKKPNQKNLMQNSVDVNNYLKTQNPKNVTIVGQSLGTALASYQYSFNDSDKLLLISPFNNFIDLSKYYYWYYPVKFMLRNTYPTDEWIKDANNVYIIHGSNDTTVPVKFGYSLFNTVKGPNKKYIEVKNAGHNDIFNYIETQKAIEESKSNLW